MKKLRLLYFLLIFLHQSPFAQKQANVWYFGVGAGLDFKQLPPLPLFNSVINSTEGSAVMADDNGRLLFYTNGIKVVNRKHQNMKNGAGLLGDLSSTDNVIIAPLPGNDSIYYIFTIGSAYQTNKGLRYSIVNMKGDAGFGEVVEKNTLLESEAFEKLAAVKHCNNKDVWVVTHMWNSDQYLSYKLTASGINATPVISNTNFTITGDKGNSIGTLKFSGNGNKLAAIHSYANNIVELLNFDNITGLLSSPVYIKPDLISGTANNFTGVYGAEFSPDDRLLYISDNFSFDNPGIVYQYNITTHDSTAIAATKLVAGNTSGGVAGALQKAPDNKIYVAVLNSSYLSAIENPNNSGAACGFTEDKIFIGQNNTASVQLGLPRFISNYFNPASYPYSFTRSGKCTDKNIQFNINRITGIDSVKWNFGDGQQSQQFSPVHFFANSGIYNVSLIVYKIDCSGLNDTVTKNIWIAADNNLLGKDTGDCTFQNFTISANGNIVVPNINYLWNTGSTDDKTDVTAPGKYWLEVEQQGCTLADTITVALLPKPFVEVGKDTFVCATTGVILNTGNNTATAYLWSTGETVASIKVFTPGVYSVTVTKGNCTATDSSKVVWGDCPFYMPNAFTPNGDGVNDKFGLLNANGLKDFVMKIYNRYGQVVYTSNNSNGKWDGNFKGKTMPGGVYTWQIIYKNGLDYTKWLKGTVLLLR